MTNKGNIVLVAKGHYFHPLGLGFKPSSPHPFIFKNVVFGVGCHVNVTFGVCMCDVFGLSIFQR